MSGAKLVLVLAMGGGLFASYRYGYLNDFLARFGLETQTGNVVPGPVPGKGIVPVLGDEETITTNQWEALLLRNNLDCSFWAQSNRRWVAGQMKQESGSLGPNAVSSAGALGVLQVMPATASEMYGRGYTKYPATAAVLKTEAGGVYYGTAYMEYLSKINSSRDWITCAYFGGPGWQGKNAVYQKQCTDYLAAVRAQYTALYGKGAA